MIDKHLNLSTLDRLFITTCVSGTTGIFNAERKLNRFEFLEIIVRMAISKYRDTGYSTSISDALGK